MKTIEHVYEPRGACKEVFHSRDAEVLISGPAGTGKSRACLEKIHMMALKNPGLRALLVRKTLSSLGSTGLVTWRKYVAREALDTGEVVYYGGSSQEAPQYRYRNGSSVTIGGLDRPTRIMSSEYDIIYVQEATELKKDDWEILTTRLRNWSISFQQLLGDCNPASDKHWLNVRCQSGDTRMLHSRHEDNPTLFNDNGTMTEYGADYMAKLDRLTGVRHKRLRLGLWVAAEGVVYEEFDPAYHVIDRAPIPDDWTRIWSVDFGYTNPFVCQFWAIDPDGALILYREIYMTGRTVAEHCQTIRSIVTKTRTEHYHDMNSRDGMISREVTEWTEPKPRAIVCDWDAEGRATLEQELGLGTVKAYKDIAVGIDLVKERLKPRGDGYAGLYIMRDSLVERDIHLVDQLYPQCTEDEFPAYVWDERKKEERLKEEPVDRDNHGMDTTRYVVAYEDKGMIPRIRFLG